MSEKAAEPSARGESGSGRTESRVAKSTLPRKPSQSFANAPAHSEPEDHAFVNNRRFEQELLYGETTETLRALLQSLGLNQKELAHRLGLSEARVSRILNGRENLTLKTLAGLGWALGVRFALAPIPFQDRIESPAANDDPAPAWIYRQRRAVAQQHRALRPAEL
jgi:transcriptional regulator with XRE-family HTH domain